MPTKYIFITGGVVSSLGKGLAAASIGRLMEARGFSVTLQKLDPYLNVDPGTMSPFQHGEVYVTEDGVETDLDLGHYERFTSTVCSRDHVARVKPAPDLFLLAATRLGVAPERCVVFEDSPNGIRAARAAGMRCVAIPNAVTCALPMEGADLVLTSLGERPLAGILGRLDRTS